MRARPSANGDRDIATGPRITENTAANHVRSILTKTGAANRTQVALMAVARGWVRENGSGAHLAGHAAGSVDG